MEKEENASVTVGLAGNPNVGKSVIFHRVTGLGVIISNYPGTTVEVAEGNTNYKDEKIHIVDLPGIYSLGAVAEDELVARKEILEEDLDVIIDIIDATNLERNLYLTLQLLELERPMIIALNQYDAALQEGIKIDSKTLSEELGVPVIPTVATRGENVSEAFAKAIELGSKGETPKKTVKMGKDLEKSIRKLTEVIDDNLESTPFDIPPRGLAIKLLEGDSDVIELIPKSESGEIILEEARRLAKVIQEEHGERAAFRIARERHGIANLIAKKATKRTTVQPSFSERLSQWTTEPKTGVPIMIGVFLGLLALLFFGGGFLEKILVDGWSDYVAPHLAGFFNWVAPNAEIAEALNIGINQGMEGILAVMIPFILTFFLALAILEDSGYLPRMAFVMDSAMHKIGLHGKAVVPMLGGFGCNVPAIMATRGLNTRRERLISSFLITMIPCSARTAVILGTVGVFVGIFPALAIYGIVIGLILLVGLILNRTLSGESSGMIMEIPPLRRPALKPVLFKTWTRMKRFVYFATPLLLLGSLLIGGLDASGTMNSIVNPLSPLTVGLLGLPAVTIIPLLYGLIRKEGALVLLVAVAGPSQLGGFMSLLQLFVFALVVTIYVPCIATFGALGKEIGWKEAILITLATIGLALLVGGLIYHLNPLGL
ncbi:hypothetical protein AKJ65_04735 [candidate division MSBL1 archaeon SCGC-AAA259E19]|uniref:Ferrous iron transport protein B n=3 Tax=candidate division MSBL1 TaxID=215777 RepID=A0A133UHC7_9EURY|nr:hypothetical protein AKJ57_05955 [candidate division MSBL1 archaeon SCGC-AAA259A05]KXA93623.1 hypothetical protein AKJ64_00145 [candidate division MSBL1 archaeon SCGC-AAA259E17]KXA94329.1 hypothetical protein AKJ65_04735 [candidate division MSBL1 archaeon SCGC-AAA259E19]